MLTRPQHCTYLNAVLAAFQTSQAMARRTGKWWLTELASVVDPISLDPIRTLRYPPFELKAQSDSEFGHADSDWYDGALLASYLVSTGNFTHPISRRELERSECEALDRYLVEHRLRGGGVAAAHDRREEYAAGNPPEGSQLATLRAEADIILQSLCAIDLASSETPIARHRACTILTP